METHSKNTGFGGLSRRRCLAIWNSAAWRASQGGKSENSIAWEAVTAGKSENSLAWKPHGKEKWKFPSLGSPHGGGKWKFLAWEAPTGEKWKFPRLGSPHGGEKPKFPWFVSTPICVSESFKQPKSLGAFLPLSCSMLRPVKFDPYVSWAFEVSNQLAQTLNWTQGWSNHEGGQFLDAVHDVYPVTWQVQKETNDASVVLCILWTSYCSEKQKSETTCTYSTPFSQSPLRCSSSSHRLYTREAPTPSPKIISISGAQNEPKASPLYLLVLVMTIFPFLSVDERGPVFPKPAIEALRSSARPGRGHASDAKRIGTRTKRCLRGLETI